MDYKILASVIIAIAIISSLLIFYVADLEQEIRIQQSRYTPERLIYVDGNLSEFFEGTQELKKFSSQEEVHRFIAALAASNMGERYPDKWVSANGGFMLEEAMEVRAASSESLDRSVFPVPEPEPEPFSLSDQSSSLVVDSSDTDYSTTNVQVKGVDESDFLKTDGKYVYIVSEQNLKIVEAYPAEDAKIIFKSVLDIEPQNLQNMFLNDDRLAIFYYGTSQDEIIPEYDFAPRSIHRQTTHVSILDISDKEDPKIIKDYSVDGSFQNARMIDNHVYFVTTSGIDYRHPVIPLIMEDSEFALAPDVYYFDNFDRNYNFNTITAIDLFGDSINSETFLMGGTGTIYVSQDSLYITYRQDYSHGYLESMERQRFFDVVVPLLPESAQDKISEIKDNSSLDWYERWIMISDILQDTYNQLDKTSKKRLFSEINKKIYQYDQKIQEESRRTVIHKISLDENNLEYQAKGSVPGYLLNQFSMDEYDGKFRVATTNDYYSHEKGNVRYNAVYVLDENLHTVGSLDEIAPNESIFSARFMGERLYLVTFKRIDPFFVIDLSQNTPKILGELKIPGFSNYLHPYDEEHIIGIGRDTIEKDNRVRQLGVKIALFDVSDVYHPIVVDEVVIGNKRTDSIALDDHRAFLFDKSKDILSIPIHSRADALVEDINTELRYQEWYGFYVYSLDATDGFELKGRVQHMVGDTWPYSHTSPRSFYINDVLYTTSDLYLKMNDLSDIQNELNSVKLDERTGGFIDTLR